MGKKNSTSLDEIIKEAKRICESTLYSSKGHFVAANIWSKFNYIIGIPIVALSGIAGASALSDFDKSSVIAGSISIIVAGLSALMTFLNPNEKASHHLSSGNSYDALNNRCRIFWTVDCKQNKSDEVLADKLKALSEQKDKLNHSSPQIPWWAYEFAKKGIEKGQADFLVDKQTV